MRALVMLCLWLVLSALLVIFLAWRNRERVQILHLVRRRGSTRWQHPR